MSVSSLLLNDFKELHWFCQKCDTIAIDAIQTFNSTESTPRSDILSAVTGVTAAAIQSLQEALKTTVINEVVSAKTSYSWCALEYLVRPCKW